MTTKAVRAASHPADRSARTREVLRKETAAWQAQRNRDAVRVDWRFTTADARIKLKSLYPSIRH